MSSASYSGTSTTSPGSGTGTGSRYPFQDHSASRVYPAPQDSQHPLPPTPPAPPPHDEPLSLTKLSPGASVAEKNVHEQQHPLPPLPPLPPSKSFYNNSKPATPAFIETFMARHPRIARHRRRFAALLFTLVTLLVLLIVLLAVLLSPNSGSGGYEEGIGGGGNAGSDGGSPATDEDLKKHNQGIPRPPINRSNAGGWTKQGKGEGTYYDPSVRVGTDKFTMGACEFEYINSMQDMIAALNKPDFGNFPRSSNSPACAQCIRVTGPNGTVEVQIVDMCPGCKSGDVDLTPGAFSRIAHIDAGRVPITWERCP